MAAVIRVEIVEGSNLFDFVNASSEPDTKVACYFIRQILDAITHFHNEVKFAHRDLKLDNIMVLKNDFSIKIIDFGFGTKIRD